jgi:hypothetical protein
MISSNIAVDTVTPLQFIRKGLRADDIALMVVIQFPLELLVSVAVTRRIIEHVRVLPTATTVSSPSSVSSSNNETRPHAALPIWIRGYSMCLLVALLAPLALTIFPDSHPYNGMMASSVSLTASSTLESTTTVTSSRIAHLPYLLITTITLLLLGSIGNKTMFIAQGAFFNWITDTSFGGSYVTFLYTMSNLGWVSIQTSMFMVSQLVTMISPIMCHS